MPQPFASCEEVSRGRYENLQNVLQSGRRAIPLKGPPKRPSRRVAIRRPLDQPDHRRDRRSHQLAHQSHLLLGPWHSLSNHGAADPPLRSQQDLHGI